VKEAVQREVSVNRSYEQCLTGQIWVFPQPQALLFVTLYSWNTR